MPIQPVGKTINFKRALATQEKKNFTNTMKKALEVLGVKDITTIIPEASFPVQENSLGIGQLNSQISSDFLDFFKTYTGMNSVKILPQGEYDASFGKTRCIAYKTSSLSLGKQTINIEKLASDEMNNILSQDTLKKVLEEAGKSKENGLANFDFVIGTDTQFDNALKEAFDNLNKLNDSVTLKQDFNKYCKENENVFDRKALFDILSKLHKTTDYEKWEGEDKILFTDEISEQKRNARINELKTKYKDDYDFCFFKQFLADRNIQEARENMHKKGISLTGDMLVAFSRDEKWGYPQAFDGGLFAKSPQNFIGNPNWRIKKLDFNNIMQEGSPSNTLFKQKVKQFAKRYDRIRVDVGWSYIKEMGYSDDLLNLLEETVKEVQGDKFSEHSLIYEIEANPKDFRPWDSRTGNIISSLRNRKIILSTNYMSSEYATPDFLKSFGVPKSDYILMAGNHDNISLNSFARSQDPHQLLSCKPQYMIDAQSEVLAKDLKLDAKQLKNSPEEFVKAKFAYNFLAENIKMFFMDIYGRMEQFDPQKNATKEQYRYMIPTNYEEAFHEALQKNSGFNIMDSISKAMKAQGMDKTNPDLYNEVTKYAKILYAKGAKTEVEANKHIKNMKTLKKTLGIAGAFIAAAGIAYFSFKQKNKSPEEIQKSSDHLINSHN